MTVSARFPNLHALSIRTRAHSVIVCLCMAIPALAAPVAHAEVVERKIEYKAGDAPLVGYLFLPAPKKEKSAAVIVFSDWMGVGEFAKQRARELAQSGYVAFAADIYGGGKQAKDTDEAGKLATSFKKDRPLFRARAKAAYEVVAKDAAVDTAKIGAMGFCFGGTASLELARTGAPIAGLVSFHGGLDSAEPALAKDIKGSVLVLHGADDPLVPDTEVKAFEDEMRKGGVRWEMVKYGGAVHAFTNPAAGNDPSKGFAYNAHVAERAYREMREFFAEIFAHESKKAS